MDTNGRGNLKGNESVGRKTQKRGTPNSKKNWAKNPGTFPQKKGNLKGGKREKKQDCPIIEKA